MSVELLNRGGGALLWVNRVTRSGRSNGAPGRFNFQIWLRYAALSHLILLTNKELQRAAAVTVDDHPIPPSTCTWSILATFAS
jgi:hypothetical protein